MNSKIHTRNAFNECNRHASSGVRLLTLLSSSPGLVRWWYHSPGELPSQSNLTECSQSNLLLGVPAERPTGTTGTLPLWRNFAHLCPARRCSGIFAPLNAFSLDLAPPAFLLRNQSPTSMYKQVCIGYRLRWRSDIWSTNLGCASVGAPDIRPPPQTISYTDRISWRIFTKSQRTRTNIYSPQATIRRTYTETFRTGLGYASTPSLESKRRWKSVWMIMSSAHSFDNAGIQPPWSTVNWTEWKKNRETPFWTGVNIVSLLATTRGSLLCALGILVCPPYKPFWKDLSYPAKERTLEGHLRPASGFVQAGKNLRDILVHTKLARNCKSGNQGTQPGTYPCGSSSRCKTCAFVKNLTEVITGGKTYTIRGHFNCQSVSAIYLILLALCVLRPTSARQASCSLRERLNGHRHVIKEKENTPVGLHFQGKHSVRVSVLASARMTPPSAA